MIVHAIQDDFVMIKRKPVPVIMGNDPQTRPLMPGSFDAGEDLFSLMDVQEYHGPKVAVDIFPDPIKAWEERQASWTVFKPSNEWLHGEADRTDWRKVDPPAALRKAPNVTSHVLLEIVVSSIDSVHQRIKTEIRDEEAAKEAASQEAKGKGKEPYLPIIMVEDKLAPVAFAANKDSESESTISVVSSSTERATSSRDASPHSTAPSDLPVFSGGQKHHKTRDFAIRRLFKRNAEKGESSSDGSAREGLLQRLKDTKVADGSKATEQKTNEPLARLRRRLISPQVPDSMVECVSCLEDMPSRSCVKVQCHEYCTECFVRLVTTACENEAQWPPKCCLNHISFALIRKNIPLNLRKTFNERSAEWEVPAAERVYCWKADCSLFIQPRKFKINNSTGTCDKGHATCLNCRNESHGQDDCPMDQAVILTNQMAEEEGWRRCYSCRILVEHADACQHMTCRCGAEFCYVCGLRWRTCRCTLADLDQVKDRAQEKRDARRLRDEAADADAEELRQILAQIEEFEKEETRKAELLAEQRRQEAKERREREVLERVKAESARVRDIGQKFRHLRNDLDVLHDLQLVLVEMDHEDATAALIREGTQDLAQLKAKHKEKVIELQAHANAKFAARKHTLNKEYMLRAATEAKLESEFRKQLLDFWKDDDNGAAEMDAAMLRLQQQMDRKFRAWQRWEVKTLGALYEKLDEGMVMQKELMWSAEERLKGQLEERSWELAQKGEAHKKWVEAVMLEREKMVNELEVEEIDGDADVLEDHDVGSESGWEDAQEVLR